MHNNVLLVTTYITHHVIYLYYFRLTTSYIIPMTNVCGSVELHLDLYLVNGFAFILNLIIQTGMLVDKLVYMPICDDTLVIAQVSPIRAFFTNNLFFQKCGKKNMWIRGLSNLCTYCATLVRASAQIARKKEMLYNVNYFA